MQLGFSNSKVNVNSNSCFDHYGSLKGNIILYIDASALAIGAVLMPDKKVVSYESHKLNTDELNHPVHKKELLAIIHSLRFGDIIY